MSRTFRAALAGLLVVSSVRISRANDPEAAIKVEAFDRDPGWDAHNNRVAPTSA